MAFLIKKEDKQQIKNIIGIKGQCFLLIEDTLKVIFSFIVDPGNTTSTSLKKYSASQGEHNNTVRTSSFIDKKSKDTL